MMKGTWRGFNREPCTRASGDSESDGLLRPPAVQYLTLTCTGLKNLSTTSSRSAVDKSLLSKLRKQTGIPFINCKKALEKFDNDFDQAKKWLEEEAQREGWAKATKLQSRPMSQGLIGVLGDQRQATMIEVNCETDFVARNEQFVGLVKKLLQECDAYFKNQSQNKVTLSKETLNHLASSQSTSLGDMVALTVGNLGENMALRRAAFLRADSADGFLSSYVHPTVQGKSPQSLKLGKYGAIVELKQNESNQQSVMPVAKLGSHLCQHIVGMNPQSIGEYVPEENSSKNENEGDSSSSSDESEESGSMESEKESEDRLLCQEYLLDTSMTVGQMTHLNGVTITNFVRFACGEEADDDDKGS